MTSHKYHRRGGDAVVNFVVMLVVLITIALVAGYAAGWIRFQSNPDNATIEFKTREMQQAGQQAADEAGRGLQKIGENTQRALHNAEERIHEATAPDHRDTTPAPIPIEPTEPIPPQPNSTQAGPPAAPEVIPDIPRR
jgi:hypothetical protein